MLKYFWAIFLITLSACSFNKPVVDVVEKPPLNLTQLRPLTLDQVKFKVIHKDNAEKIFSSMEDAGQEPVMFCLTGNNYKAISKNTERIKNRMILQNKVIKLYVRYYEGGKNVRKQKQ
jgi:hypothetical protein